MRVHYLAVLAALFLAACGSDGVTTSSDSQSSVVASLPTTLEGDFVIDVEEGDEDVGDGNSEFNFGTLTVSGEDIPVVVSGSVLQSAGFSGGASGKVRATISAKTDEYGPTSYIVTSLQRL